MDKFPGLDVNLRSWFILLQAKYAEVHVSCAGRGFLEQEVKKAEGRSNASYGKSAHNYNCAIDIFLISPGKDMYDKNWFNGVLAPEIPPFLNWYGTPGSAYPELPHIEVRDWKDKLSSGKITLVEKIPNGAVV